MPCLLAVDWLPIHNHPTAMGARLFHVIYDCIIAFDVTGGGLFLISFQREFQTTALEFEGALEVEACLAGDFYAIGGDCGLHEAAAGAELLGAQRVLAEASCPIGSQGAVD